MSFIEIGNKNTRIACQEFKGKFYVHIRQWYEKDGEMCPGKGIALTLDEWKEFSDKLPEIKSHIEGVIQ